MKLLSIFFILWLSACADIREYDLNGSLIRRTISFGITKVEPNAEVPTRITISGVGFLSYNDSFSLGFHKYDITLIPPEVCTSMFFIEKDVDIDRDFWYNLVQDIETGCVSYTGEEE